MDGEVSMNYYYLFSIILTELIMIAMLVHVAKYNGFTKNQKLWYIYTFSAIILCSMSEFVVHCGYYNKSFKILLYILTIAQFSTSPLLGILFSGALGVKNNKKYILIFYGVSILIEAILAPFGLVFYFDDAGYHRGSAFLIYEILFILSLVYLLVSMVLVGRKFKKRDLFTIVMILLIVIAGIIPMAVYRINISYTAIAISACLSYIYYNDLVQQDIQTELIANQERISGMQEHMISGLANMIENRDLETGGHIFRTSLIVKKLSTYVKEEKIYDIDDNFISLMQTLSPLHDIGKILVSDSILRKPGKLTNEEFELMKLHAAKGGEVVQSVLNGVAEKDYLKFASDIATYHHEWWNGTGYPKKLKGEEIPLSARIMAIADVYDALISERCYKKAIKPEEAFKIIKEESGTHFDPKLVDVFLEHCDEFVI